MKKIKIGVIADDFTGASDAASFLSKSKNKTVLITDIPTVNNFDCDCLVVALKIRSVEPEEAIMQVSKVMDFFETNDIEKVYYKYCSTFDSTPKGNIGVVMDYLIERMNVKYSILCPSLPVNGRTVKSGMLYVNGVPLAESPLKNHPLNPMWDSYIPNLMKTQSKFPCYIVNEDELDNIREYDNVDNAHFYLIPDYVEDNDGIRIAKVFANLKLLSGGSGLLEYLLNGDYANDESSDFDLNKQKSVIVSGSCSEMTKSQIQQYKETNDKYYAIDANKIVAKDITVSEYVEKLKNSDAKTILFYSDGCENGVQKDSPLFFQLSKAMEDFLSNIALEAERCGFNKIIVAGGETSGSVTIKLGYSSFYVGESVAPGVPVLIPVENRKIRLILKSGNFGDKYFFQKAVEAK